MAEPQYAIEPIDPSVVFIVTLDDRPVVTHDGQPLHFARRIDAERFIERRRDGSQ